MFEWLKTHDTLLWWLTAGSLVMFVATLAVMPVLVARLPADFFVEHPADDAPMRRAWLYWLWRVFKNVLGVVLLLMGVAMLVLPGQGLLTIVVGVMLLDFPGKRRLQARLIRFGPVFRAANWVRAKRRRPPFIKPARG